MWLNKILLSIESPWKLDYMWKLYPKWGCSCCRCCANKSRNQRSGCEKWSDIIFVVHHTFQK